MKILGDLEVILGNLQNYAVHGTAANISFQIEQSIGGTSWTSGQLVLPALLCLKDKIRETRMGFFVD